MKNQQPRPKGRGMWFCKVWIVCGFNTQKPVFSEFESALEGGILNPSANKKVPVTGLFFIGPPRSGKRAAVSQRKKIRAVQKGVFPDRTRQFPNKNAKNNAKR
jgi:hypothetical protein